MNQIELLKLNVNDHVEKKQNLSYLSWAWAWAEALKADPAATFEVKTFDGKPYMDVNGTGMVWVTVTMFGKPMTCFLPVMNHRNQPIQNPDSFQVNTSIMRCMTKGLALHGLGLYIYAGEDLPQGNEPEPVIVKAVTPDGTEILVADRCNAAIRRIDVQTGEVGTLVRTARDLVTSQITESGPGFASFWLPQNIDIAPTISNLLKISYPNGNEGNVIEEALK